MLSHTLFPQNNPSRQPTPNRSFFKDQAEAVVAGAKDKLAQRVFVQDPHRRPASSPRATSGPSPNPLAEIWPPMIDVGGVATGDRSAPGLRPPTNNVTHQTTRQYRIATKATTDC